jgi:broad specificity phosphatase PhoE
LNKYVLLMRHASHHAVLRQRPGPGARMLSAEGKQQTTSVAERLAEVCNSEGVRFTSIRYAPSDEAKETGDIVLRHLSRRVQQVVEIDLDSSHLALFRKRKELRKFAKRLGNFACPEADRNDNGNAVLVS